MRTAELPAHSPVRFRGLAAFTACEWRVQLHEETAILTSMLTQAVLLTFVAVLSWAIFPVALVGAILFSAFTLGQRVLNEAAYVRIDHKLNDLFLASPLAPESYFFGTAIGVLLAYLPPILALGALAVAVLHPGLLLSASLVAAAALVWLFSSSLGYVLSTFFRDQRAIWSYASLLYNFFGVLPPVFYPIGLFPRLLRPVALVMPPSAAAALVQNALSPGTLNGLEFVLALAALSAASVGTFVFAIYWARRSVRGN